VVAAGRLLDLDDVGAEISKVLADESGARSDT